MSRQGYNSFLFSKSTISSDPGGTVERETACWRRGRSERGASTEPAIQEKFPVSQICRVVSSHVVHCCFFFRWNIVDLISQGVTTGKGRRTSPFLATILFSSLHFLPPSSSTGSVSSQKIQINNDQTKQIFIQWKLHPLHQLLTVEPYRLALCFLCASATRSQHAMAPSPDLDFPLPSGR